MISLKALAPLSRASGSNPAAVVLGLSFLTLVGSSLLAGGCPAGPACGEGEPPVAGEEEEEEEEKVGSLKELSAYAGFMVSPAAAAAAEARETKVWCAVGMACERVRVERERGV